ncbi:ectoine/hydroxyectoine ABC transporter permease subunit EhuC [Streptomyces sp. SID3343]|uniref:ectoine/hydroxyectoine ABC transporter permease subunit EhuC n=1 Tax=Streptomyces sp. SID3343 TaxID=2690260 RepID=UPI00136E973A|nr:ectoine/hydroxyectoine ABC transporter permease subunit EhuC [Streptomyces sp. SID3343]MYV98190.1 ectoine/hydroxyectoine ABC transporter permease subunit EhuC [Streptomyces sp. SID3343]
MTSGQIGLLLDGALNTIYLTLGGAAVGLLLALAAGLARSSDSRLLRVLGGCYVEVFRGLPTLVLAFWFVFVLPAIGWQLEPLWAGMLALGLNIGAYAAEVVRGAIKAVPPAQLEAATALNFTRAQRIRRVVLPQAYVAMLPPLGNNLIELLKMSAVVSIVSIPDLTFNGQLIRMSSGETTLVFTGLLFGYGLIALVLTSLMHALERHAARSLGRTPAPGPLRRILRRAEAAA